MAILNTLGIPLIYVFSISYLVVEKNKNDFFSVSKMNNSILYLYDKMLPP